MPTKIALSGGLFSGVLAFLTGPATNPVMAQDNCPNRSQLDVLDCDANNDLVADVPPANRQSGPSAMIFAYKPVEDPAVDANVFKPLMAYLGTCTGKRWVYFPVQSNLAQIEAMRSARLHVAGYSTGPTGFAVNIAGAVPFAAKERSQQASEGTICCPSPSQEFGHRSAMSPKDNTPCTSSLSSFPPKQSPRGSDQG